MRCQLRTYVAIHQSIDFIDRLKLAKVHRLSISRKKMVAIEIVKDHV